MSHSQIAPRAPGPLVTAAVLLVASMTIMANATISPSLPGIREHFADRAGIDTLAGLLLTLPSLSILLTAGLWGWQVDRANRQTLLIVAGLLYAVGGTSGLWATSLEMMLVGRAVLGVGVAGSMTLAMAWGADLWQGPARARFLGFQGAAMSAGGVVVMLLGGALAELHWRGAFAVYALVLPVLVVAVIALRPHVLERAAIPARERAEIGHDGAFPWGTYAFIGGLGFLFMAVFYVMPTRMPFLMQERGLSNSFLIGVTGASMTLAAIPGALLYGRMRRFLSANAIFALSYAGMGLGLLAVGLAQGPAAFIAGSMLLGLGMGPSMPNYTTTFMAVVPPSQRGRAAGLLTTAFFAGQFASPLLSAPLVARFGLTPAFEVLAVAMLLIALALAILALAGRRQPLLAPGE